MAQFKKLFNAPTSGNAVSLNGVQRNMSLLLPPPQATVKATVSVSPSHVTSGSRVSPAAQPTSNGPGLRRAYPFTLAPKVPIEDLPGESSPKRIKVANSVLSSPSQTGAKRQQQKPSSSLPPLRVSSGVSYLTAPSATTSASYTHFESASSSNPRLSNSSSPHQRGPASSQGTGPPNGLTHIKKEIAPATCSGTTPATIDYQSILHSADHPTQPGAVTTTVSSEPITGSATVTKNNRGGTGTKKKKTTKAATASVAAPVVKNGTVPDAATTTGNSRKRAAATEGRKTSGKKAYIPSYIGKDEKCVVCGDLSTGLHYRALTCEGCKGFFRRTIQKNKGELPNFVCKSNNSCVINQDTRNNCSACRFNNCLIAKMDHTAVLNDKKREDLKELITKNRKVRETQQRFKLSTDMHDNIRRVGRSYKPDNPSSFYCYHGGGSGVETSPGGMAINGPGVAHMLQFIKTLPGIEKVKDEDISILLDQRLADLFIIQVAETWNEQTGELVLSDHRIGPSSLAKEFVLDYLQRGYDKTKAYYHAGYRDGFSRPTSDEGGGTGGSRSGGGGVVDGPVPRLGSSHEDAQQGLLVKTERERRLYAVQVNMLSKDSMQNFQNVRSKVPQTDSQWVELYDRELHGCQAWVLSEDFRARAVERKLYRLGKLLSRFLTQDGIVLGCLAAIAFFTTEGLDDGLEFTDKGILNENVKAITEALARYVETTKPPGIRTSSVLNCLPYITELHEYHTDYIKRIAQLHRTPTKEDLDTAIPKEFLAALSASASWASSEERLSAPPSNSSCSVSTGPPTPASPAVPAAEIDDQVRVLATASRVLNGFVSPSHKVQDSDRRGSRVEHILKNPPELMQKGAAPQKVSLQQVARVLPKKVVEKEEGVTQGVQENPRNEDCNGVGKSVARPYQDKREPDVSPCKPEVELYLVPTSMPRPEVTSHDSRVSRLADPQPAGTDKPKSEMNVDMPKTLKEDSNPPAPEGYTSMMRVGPAGVNMGNVATPVYRNGYRSLVESCLQTPEDRTPSLHLTPPRVISILRPAGRGEVEIRRPIISGNGRSISPRLPETSTPRLLENSAPRPPNSSTIGLPQSSTQRLPPTSTTRLREVFHPATGGLNFPFSERSRSPVETNRFDYAEDAQPLNLTSEKTILEKQLAEISNTKERLLEKLRSLDERQKYGGSSEPLAVQPEPEPYRARSSSFGGTTSVPSLPFPDARTFSPPSCSAMPREMSWNPLYHQTASTESVRHVSPLQHEHSHVYGAPDTLDRGLFLRPYRPDHLSPAPASSASPSPRLQRSQQILESPRDKGRSLVYQTFTGSGNHYTDRVLQQQYHLQGSPSPGYDRSPGDESREKPGDSDFLGFMPSTGSIAHRLHCGEQLDYPPRRSTVAQLLSRGLFAPPKSPQRVSPLHISAARPSAFDGRYHQWPDEPSHDSSPRYPVPCETMSRHIQLYPSQRVVESCTISPPQITMTRYITERKDPFFQQQHKYHRSVPSPNFEHTPAALPETYPPFPGLVQQSSPSQSTVQDLLRNRSELQSKSTAVISTNSARAFKEPIHPSPSVSTVKPVDPPPSVSTVKSVDPPPSVSTVKLVDPPTSVSTSTVDPKYTGLSPAGSSLINGKVGSKKSIKKRWLELHSSEETLAPPTPTAFTVERTTRNHEVPGTSPTRQPLRPQTGPGSRSRAAGGRGRGRKAKAS